MVEQKFVGRQIELRQLEQFLINATTGRAQVVFVAGEAGAGKSALVHAFVQRAQETDEKLVAAMGECNAQTGAGDAYLPFRQVLTVLAGADDEKQTGNAVTSTNAARLKEFVRVAGETLIDIGPDLIGIFVPGASLVAKLAMSAAKSSKLADKLSERVGKPEISAGAAINPQLDQAKIFEQYTNVLRALAQEHSLLLLLDDLHWADSASLNLLFHLARQLKDSRVLLVGTYRPDDVALGRGGERHPLEPLVNELKRYNGDIVIDLGAARASEGRAFVDALIDAEPNQLDAAFRQELFARTEGNPLFTVELLQNLQERGDLAKDAAGRWIQGTMLDWNALPPRVEGVIEERIARLADDPSPGVGQSLRETLNIASVMGLDFNAQVIAQVQEVKLRDLLRNLSRELEKRHRLVQESGEVQVGTQILSLYRFVHVLFQQFLYNELGTGEQRVLNGEVAAALETLYEGRTDEIAVQLGRLYRESGNAEKAAFYLIKAGERAARAYANTEARALYKQALEELARLPDSTENRHRRAETLLYLARLEFTHEKADLILARLAEAETLADNPDDRLLLARIYQWRGQLHLGDGHVHEGMRYLELALAELQSGAHDEELTARVSTSLAFLHVSQGHFRTCESLLLPAVGPLEKFGVWFEWMLSVTTLSMIHTLRGDYATGAAEAQRAVDKMRQIQFSDWIGASEIFLCIDHMFGGNPAPALEIIHTLTASEEHLADRPVFGVSLYILQAWAESQLGNHDAATKSLATFQANLRPSAGRAFSIDWLTAIAAEVLLNAGRPAEALTTAGRALTLAQEIEDSFGAGLAHRALGRALAKNGAAHDAAANDTDGARARPAQAEGKMEDAEMHFAASLTALESEAPVEAARTRVAWGRMYIEYGAKERARGHLEKAEMQFEGWGFALDLAETRTLLRELAV